MAHNTKRGVIGQTAVVILAGGSGTRMKQAGFAKVCFEIDGQPAINRTVGTLKKLGFCRPKFRNEISSSCDSCMSRSECHKQLLNNRNTKRIIHPIRERGKLGKYL